MRQDDVEAGQTVVVPVSTVMGQEMYGLPPMLTTAVVLRLAERYGEGMWWLRIDLATGGQGLEQLYNADEISGLYVGPPR